VVNRAESVAVGPRADVSAEAPPRQNGTFDLRVAAFTGLGLRSDEADAVTVAGSAPFGETEIRTAERALVTALEAPDPTACVFEYTEDAIFDGGSEHVVQGREALLALARTMQPMSSVVFEPLRTEGHGPLATVWFEASWIRGRTPDTTAVPVRGVLLWRKGADGRWRVAIEHVG
jgi:ketosteroid isomerase-like protein